MSLYRRIDDENRSFLREFRQILNALVQKALLEERWDLAADETMRRLVSVGRIGVERNDESVILHEIPSYSPEPWGGVANLYHFVDRVYKRSVRLTGAFSEKQAAERHAVEEALEQRKRAQFEELSRSMVAGIEAIMETDQKVIEAKSRQHVDKMSYTGIRDIALCEEETQRRLETMSRARGVNVTVLYKRLQDLRLQLKSQDRKKTERLRVGAVQVGGYFRDFLDAIEEPVDAMARINYADVPDVDSLEKIPLVDKWRLGETFSRIVSADRTLVPQRAADGEHLYPMPQIVLLPVLGYAMAATTLAVEKFRENAIFLPMRLLEDPVRALAREILRLKRKMDGRRFVLLRDAYHEWVRRGGLMAGGYDEMYEKYLRFALGEAAADEALTETERRVIEGHFVPEYADDLFVPPELRPVLLQLSVGGTGETERFNSVLDEYEDDPFVLGILYADRALKYDALLEERGGLPGADRESLRRFAESAEKDFRVACQQFDGAARRQAWVRFSFYNKAVLIGRHRKRNVSEAEAREAIALLGHSREHGGEDLWAFKAACWIEMLESLLPREAPASAATETRAFSVPVRREPGRRTEAPESAPLSFWRRFVRWCRGLLFGASGREGEGE